MTPTLADRFRAWRDRRRTERCARDLHRWRSLTPDRVCCRDCGTRWGA